VTTHIDRRSFLTRGAAAAGALALPLEALTEKTLAAGVRMQGPGYGPLQAAIDQTTGLPLILLPEGFRYFTFGWTGDPLDDARPTPGAHDGMAAIRTYRGFSRIVRNHEIDGSGTPFASTPVYDVKGGGGTTTSEFDLGSGRLVRSWGSLSGTVRNCAGGPTPWGSWLTCEETVVGPDTGGNFAQPHGYIFEVPAFGTATAEPLMAMGRFTHEAIAVDPTSGIVYETEDRGTAGLYRFIPNTPGRLVDGGRLQMLGIKDKPKYDTRRNQTAGVWQDAVWYDIADPNRAHSPNTTDTLGVFSQGFAQGGAVFARLEGAWYGNGLIYVNSTSGGNAGAGQVWAYDPMTDKLLLLYESPGVAVLDSPDNLTVSPRGGLVLCEDGSGLEYLHGLTPEGEIFRFCQNNVRLNGERNNIRGDFTGSEFAGATYSPDGRWLFFNIQSPGVTFAVTGPWENGAL
jgi:uncharacterized protein